MSKRLVIGHFYKKLLNLYGDNGNVEILKYRANSRGFDVELIDIDHDVPTTSETLQKINLLFIGGGPDAGQKQMVDDLVKNKAHFIKEYVENDGVALLVCGSYQLLGHYYLAADGNRLDGVGALDLYTQHFGKKKPRCIGNTVAKLSDKILNDPVFKTLNCLDGYVTGFENHGGRTFLGSNLHPFARIVKGNGNNSVDGNEGVFYKNTIGTYFHGPLLARNFHLADFLICKALGVQSIAPLHNEDVVLESLAKTVHTASLKLK